MAKRKVQAARRTDAGLGSEPIFETQPEVGPDRNAAKARAHYWYNYFHKSVDQAKWAVEWARKNMKLTKEELEFLRHSAGQAEIVTVGNLSRMEKQGLLLNEEEIEWMTHRVRVSLNRGRMAVTAERDAAALAVPTGPLVKRVSCLMLEALDELEDAWMQDKYPKFSVFNRNQTAHAPQAQLKGPVTDWIKSRLDIYKDPSERKEHLHHLSKRQIDKIVVTLEEMMTEITTMTAGKARAARVKKPISAEKQVRGLAYKALDSEFALKSLDPTKIVGAKRVFLFRSDQRKLIEIVAKEGQKLGAKGKAITGVDEAACRQVTLRKPEDMLPIVLGKTLGKIHGAWSALTTKTAPHNGRTHKEAVILRVMSE